MDYRKNINNINNLKNLNECKKLIVNKNFQMIGKGEEAKVYKVISETCGNVVMKVYNNKTKNEIYKEITILDKAKMLIEKDICPHLVYYYDFNLENDLFYILMEYADGDLERLLYKDLSNELWKNMVFQILIGILAIQKYMKGYHRDLHFRNVFYKNIEKGGCFEYLIDNEKYYLPNLGYLVMIADYGLLQSPVLDNNVMEDDEIEAAIRENRDLKYLFKKIDSPSIKNRVYNLEKYFTAEELHKRFHENKDFIEYYNKVKEEPKINKYLKYYSLYYCIEHNLLNYEEELKKKNIKERKFLKRPFPYKQVGIFKDNFREILNSNDDIEIIIKNYFKEYTKKNNNIIKTFNLNATI